MKQYSIAYELFSVTSRIPYYKKWSASYETYGNFQTLFKIKKENTFSIILFQYYSW